jgi:hypothetical protein
MANIYVMDEFEYDKIEEALQKATTMEEIRDAVLIFLRTMPVEWQR